MLTPSPERSSEGNEIELNQTPDVQMHSFRWGQFEKNVKRSYRRLREKKMFNDVTISCENSEVEAHKIVLSTSSDFFNRLLEQSSFRNNPHPIIHIKDVKMKHFKFILEFMYTGEVKVPQNDSTFVLQAAKELQVKGLQADDLNQLNPLIRKASSALSIIPIKRSRTSSFSPIQSSSMGSSPISLQPKIKLEESSFIENDPLEEGNDDGSQEKDKEDRQEVVEDGSQEKGKEDRQQGAEGGSQLKDKKDTQEDAEDNEQKKDQIILELILEKAVSTSSPSDEKMSRESQRAALVEKVEKGLYKCKQCEYTSKFAFNVKKHAEGHLPPVEYKCQFCPSVVKNEVYFKNHVKAKHNIKV